MWLWVLVYSCCDVLEGAFSYSNFKWCSNTILQNAHVVGLDIAKIQPDLRRAGYEDLARRITWHHADMCVIMLPLTSHMC